MGHSKALVAGALVLGGVLAACGSSSSPSPSAGAGSGTGPPRDATQATFCKTLTDISSDQAPSEIADRLNAVGTPSSISTTARAGFEVLVEHVRVLPDNPNNSDLTSLVKGLKASDRTDVLAFWTYFGNTCEPSPSASPS
jgi:hypothetical protein